MKKNHNEAYYFCNYCTLQIFLYSLLKIMQQLFGCLRAKMHHSINNQGLYINSSFIDLAPTLVHFIFPDPGAMVVSVL